MYLEKEDVSLYYEIRGKGEPLILIHGVIVDADLFHDTAEILSKYYQVITYDRRGNSRSTLKGEESLHFSMDEQITDLRDLMDELNIDSAYIVGVSAGGVVGEYFLQIYPERVKHLIVYEAAMLGSMLDYENVHAWIDGLMEIIGKRKFNIAVLRFAQHIGPMDPRSPGKPQEVSLREMGNHQYALTTEFPGLIAYKPDVEVMKSQADKITFAAGEMSVTADTIYAQAAVRLAGWIGKKPVYFPGGHNLPHDLPMEFAICVLGTICLVAKESQIYGDLYSKTVKI